MMTIRHHVTEETLLHYAAGQLSPAPARVVAVHLAACHLCRRRLAAFEAVGGALLEAIEPQPMAAGAFAAALAVIEDEAGAPRPLARSPVRGSVTRLTDDVPLPAVLADCEIGRWRWVGPGIRARRIHLPEDRAARLTLLRVSPGRALPEHGHSGPEFTQVISGSFSDAFGRYGPGDLNETDPDIEHQPIADPGEACICLAALDGGMRMKSLLARLIQPFVRL